MSHLQQYARYITAGLHGEHSTKHEEWKKVRTAEDPTLSRTFKTLENPKSWDSLFRAMNNTGFTQDDIHKHCNELRDKGEYALADAILCAVEGNRRTFDLMEMG